jgi:hypothetical protein
MKIKVIITCNIFTTGSNIVGLEVWNMELGFVRSISAA